MGKSTQGTNRDSDIKKKVEVDRSHLKETGQQHHSAGTVLEPSGKEEEELHKEFLEKGCEV